MIEIPLFISVLIFVDVLLFILGIFYEFSYRKQRWALARRVKGMEEGIRPGEKTGGFVVIRDQIEKAVGSLGDLVGPKSEGELSNLRKKFLKAGYRRESAGVIFFGAKTILAFLLAVAFILVKLFFLKDLSPVQVMFFTIFAALIGFYLPDLWLHQKIANRRGELMRGFPDALDLMVVCVEAGTGLDAAVNRVGEEMKLSNPVLSEEFQLLSLELRAGKLRRDALRNLALRTDLEDVSSLATLLIQTEKFGTSIAQALRVYSDSMRTKRRQRAEEAAAKLPVKLLLPLILFIFPSLFVVILGPGAIRIFRVFLPALGGH